MRMFLIYFLFKNFSISKGLNIFKTTQQTMKKGLVDVIRFLTLPLDPRKVLIYRKVFGLSLGIGSVIDSVDSVIDSAVLLGTQLPREALYPTIEMFRVARQFKRYGYRWCNSGSGNISYLLDMPQNSKLKSTVPKKVPDKDQKLMERIVGGELRYKRFDGVLAQEGIKFDHIKGDFFLVTATGTRMGDFGRKPKRDIGIIRIDEEGKGYYVVYGLEGSEPTSDMALHLFTYNKREEIGRPIKVVLHTHALNVTKVASLEEVRDSESLTDLLRRNLPQDITGYLLNGVGYVEPLVWGDPELIKRNSEEIAKHDLVVWEFHGPISVGERDQPRETAEDPEKIIKVFDRAKGRLETGEAAAETVLKSGYRPTDFRYASKEHSDALEAKGRRRGKT